MADPSKLAKESAAFVAWVGTFPLSRPINSLADLSDGAALFDVLSSIDAQNFRPPSRPPQAMENWVLRFSSLKRLYRLITQYYADVLHQPASALEVPDLQAVAKDYNVPETLRLCRLAIGIAVQSEKRKEVIEGIQGLEESHQSSLMRAIEKVKGVALRVGDVSTRLLGHSGNVQADATGLGRHRTATHDRVRKHVRG
ncbi:hypothetical protein M407DRAFT_211680 [Tulasnella calospora MUT 4182]|uniref:HOOK N-terminal domain-containing protein n=1 Tax=Tulasnella calospora MUT 4182 TaxID=1051891 RepID=A0A0C3QKA8_9AGAM|nr:hypothetical protein M407DRAFT_211680 [Tulasnella calospora MUT 4182]